MSLTFAGIWEGLGKPTVFGAPSLTIVDSVVVFAALVACALSHHVEDDLLAFRGHARLPAKIYNIHALQLTLHVNFVIMFIHCIRLDVRTSIFSNTHMSAKTSYPATRRPHSPISLSNCFHESYLLQKYFWFVRVHNVFCLRLSFIDVLHSFNEHFL